MTAPRAASAGPMHVLFTAVAGHGHVNPMVPLARALKGRGHRVTFITGAEMRARVEQLGFDCVAAGPTVTEMQAEALADAGVRAVLATEPWRVAAAIFATRAGAVLRDLDGADLAPDLVVHDAYELAGPVLAAGAGVPWVTHGLGPRWPSFLEDLIGTLVAHLWEAAGVRPLARGGIGHHAYIEICPPAVRADDSVTTGRLVELRPVPLDEPPHRSTLFAGSGCPRIYATLGTFTNDDPDAFQALLTACCGVDAEVVLTVGGVVDPGRLGPLPAGARVERYVPQAQILSDCDLVVCHGGSGTVLAALAHAVPLVIVPQGADQFRNAPFWERSGAAVVVPMDQLSGGTIAAALSAAVEGGPLRVAAGATAATIAAMPAVEAVADEVEALVGFRVAGEA